LHEPRVGVDEAGDVLSGRQGADEEQVAVRRDRVTRSEIGCAMAADRDPPGRHFQAPGHLGRGPCRRDDDTVGPMGMPSREPRVVASRVAVRPFRVVEEIEVVDGDDARGVARRNQEGLGGVNHVEGAAREHLDRRPLHTAPRTVQRPQRNAPVNTPDPVGKGIGAVGETIAPGGAEDGQFKPFAGFVRCREAGKCADRLVHEFAYPCPSAEGRPIVDQDAHAGRDGTIWSPGHGEAARRARRMDGR